MSDEIKHECAVALLRLLDSPAAAGGSGGAAPRSLPDPGGTLLSLLLEKQHNRGQDGAGAAILSLAPEPGRPAWWIRKSASPTALADLLGAIGRRPTTPGESLFLGHLRYATYGRGDESFCHPFVHAEPRLDRTLFLAGNFNLTNTHELFEAFRKAGNHPASTADGYLLCELLALGLAKSGARASARAAGLASAVCRGFAAPEDPEEKSLRSLRSLREETTTRDARRETSPALRSLREETTTRDARHETRPALRSLREETTTRDARRETSPALRSLSEETTTRDARRETSPALRSLREETTTRDTRRETSPALRSLREETTTRDARRETSPALRSLREETTTRDARRETSPALRSLREETTTRDTRRETSPALRSLREETTTRDARRETSPALRSLRENEPPILRALRAVLPKLDGAFTLCGMTGDGWAFAVRDAHGIRPSWYHASPRAVAVASERPAIQAALDCPTDAVRELPPGVALLVSPAGEVRFERVLEPAEPRPCVFERIYFSRANDADIHRERKALGAALAAPILRAVDFDLDRTFFSYIPNSAQVAFHGLLEALWTEGLAEGRPVRFGQVAVKDAKFRTFIADAAARREIGKHVYDVTYGLVRPGMDTLVVLDDSIVRGTTMRDAILPMLDRLGPRRIVVASSAPPIRYPDCYGIDMSTLGELVAFRALVNLLGDEAEAALRDALETLSHAESAENAESESHAESAENAESKSHAESAENAESESHAENAENAEPGSSHVSRLASLFPHAESAENAETSSFAAKRHPSFAPQAHPSFVNPLASLYARFTEEQHTAEIARLLTPPRMRAEVSVVYQTVDALHAAVKTPSVAETNPSTLQPFNLSTSPDGGAAAIGDWYFTGDYPTPGGYRVLRRSLENHLARREGRSY